MAGAYYIWIMAAFFLCACGIIALFTGLLYLGHWLEKRETGSKHGFLELPDELRSKAPEPGHSDTPDPKAPSDGSGL